MLEARLGLGCCWGFEEGGGGRGSGGGGGCFVVYCVIVDMGGKVYTPDCWVVEWTAYVYIELEVCVY